MEKLLLNRKEAASLLSVSIQSIHDKLVHRGELRVCPRWHSAIDPTSGAARISPIKFRRNLKASGGAWMSLPKPFRAAEVKARANFVDIVSQYTTLRRAGKQYIGRCPFHSERHPSFYVHPASRVFYNALAVALAVMYSRFVMRAKCLRFPIALWKSSQEFSEG